MTTSEDLLRLTPQTPLEALRELRPERSITVYLPGGQTLKGDFVRLADTTLIMAVRSVSDISVVYIPLTSMAALSIQYDTATLHQEAGKPRSEPPVAVTRLSIDRRLAAMGGGGIWRGTCRWRDFGATESTLTILSTVLDDLDALPVRLDLQGLELGGGPALSAVLTDNVLHLTLPTDDGTVMPVSRASLRQVLESSSGIL